MRISVYLSQSRWPWWLLLFILILLTGYWLCPLSGQVAIILNDASPGVWPQIQLDPLSPQPGQDVTVQVTDIEPWANFRLTVDGKAIPIQTWEILPGDLTWRWKWTFPAPQTSNYSLNFYYDCHTGCQQRGRLAVGSETAPQPNNLTPTKLCVVFPNPERNWYNRSGWGVEVTYAQLATDPGWGVDALAERVYRLTQNGMRVLVRVDYAPGQSLPPTDNQLALAEYLAYIRRLARDDRLQGVYGYFLGSSYNALGSNTLDLENPVTPTWYARLFNGYGQPVDHTDNAIQIIRAENPQTRLLVGPLQPWSQEGNGEIPHLIDVPWLNYMNTLVLALDEGTQAKHNAGIPLTAPDGFALQASGRPTAAELAGREVREEPGLNLSRDAWQGAQAGFQVYQDWLTIINTYSSTQGLPVYITSSNTFTPDEGVPPAQNYPRGWLTTALQTINAEPQVQTLCWFMDEIPGDTQWQWFNLTHHPGKLIDAAEEFDTLLQDLP